MGNTLIVVEHDEDTIRAADFVVDVGPGAGVHGGEIVATGTPGEIMACPRSVTCLLYTSVGQMIFVSATPAEYELSRADNVAEQIIRPTGLLDPKIELHPVEGQIDHLFGEIAKTVEHGGKVLVTTLTKRMAESLTDYMTQRDVRVRYLHSDIDTLERVRCV